MRKQLNGYVMSNDMARLYRYFGYGVTCPQDVKDGVEAFAAAPDDEGLIFEVSSPGGSLFAGLEMWTALKDAKRIANVSVTAEVQSLAASAASVFIAGCDSVGISPVAQVMMHLPSTYTDGDETDHQESLGMLRAGLTSILSAYEAKCGKKTSRAQLETITRATSFLTAQEAVDIGIADYIIDYSDEAGEDPMSLAAAMDGGPSAFGLPEASVLQARYDAEIAQKNGGDGGRSGDEPGLVSAKAGSDTAHPEGAPELKDDWRPRARLNVEKHKFMEV